MGVGNVGANTGGMSPAGWAFPGAQSAAENIQANPYVQYAYNESIGNAQMAPLLQDASKNYGALIAGQAPGLINAGQGALDLAPQIAGMAFDPQSALYNQLRNQTTQSANAANAASGVSGPYAANTADQALQNFDIGWQNQQLARALQGVQGYGSALGAGAGAINQAGNSAGSGLNLWGQGANVGQQFANQPGQVYGQQQQNTLGAFGNLVNLGNMAYQQPAQQSLNDLQSYLQLGQSAQEAGLLGGAQGVSQMQQGLGGLGQLAGLASPTLFGSGGLSGALGVDPSTGLIGSLFGGGGLSAGAAGAASGFGDAFAAGSGATDLGFLSLLGL